MQKADLQEKTSVDKLMLFWLDFVTGLIQNFKAATEERKNIERVAFKVLEARTRLLHANIWHIEHFSLTNALQFSQVWPLFQLCLLNNLLCNSGYSSIKIVKVSTIFNFVKGL